MVSLKAFSFPVKSIMLTTNIYDIQRRNKKTNWVQSVVFSVTFI